MKEHKCQKSKVCSCYSLALEPSENCPVHGTEWPPRCDRCGRFIRGKDFNAFHDGEWSPEIEAEIAKKREEILKKIREEEEVRDE